MFLRSFRRIHYSIIVRNGMANLILFRVFNVQLAVPEMNGEFDGNGLTHRVED